MEMKILIQIIHVHKIILVNLICLVSLSAILEGTLAPLKNSFIAMFFRSFHFISMYIEFVLIGMKAKCCKSSRHCCDTII